MGSTHKIPRSSDFQIRRSERDLRSPTPQTDFTPTAPKNPSLRIPLPPPRHSRAPLRKRTIRRQAPESSGARYPRAAPFLLPEPPPLPRVPATPLHSSASHRGWCNPPGGPSRSPLPKASARARPTRVPPAIPTPAPATHPESPAHSAYRPLSPRAWRSRVCGRRRGGRAARAGHPPGSARARTGRQGGRAPGSAG